MEYLDTVRRFLTETLLLNDAVLSKSKLDNSERNRFFVVVYASLYDYVGDLLHLVDGQRHVSLATVVRSLIDSVADFKFVLYNENGLSRLLLRDAKEKLKHVQVKLNPRLGQVDLEDEELRNLYVAEAKKINSEIESLEKQGISIADISEKYRLAGLNDYYDLIYPILSGDTHNNLSAYIARHLDTKGTANLIKYAQQGSEFELVRAMVLATEFYFRFSVDFAGICVSEVERSKLLEKQKEFNKAFIPIGDTEK